MEKEANKAEETGYQPFGKYRGAMVFAEAMQKGDKVTAESALELMSKGFGIKNDFDARLNANSLMGNPDITTQNFLPGYEQLFEKTMKEVANDIHGKFLKEKLGDQYGEFQKDVKECSEMTYRDVLKKYQRMTHLKEMVKDGSASDAEKKEAEKLAKGYELMYLGTDFAEKSELRKIRNASGDITKDKSMKYIKEKYKERTANNSDYTANAGQRAA